MKKQNIQDERVVTQRHKIKSEAFGIIMIALLTSVILQGIFFNTPLAQYAVEVICLIGMSFYTIIRYMMVGLDIYGEGKRVKFLSLISGLVVGVLATAINGVCNYTQYAERYNEDGIGNFIALLIITFISATVITFVVLSCFDYVNKKKQAIIQKVLDEEEQTNSALAQRHKRVHL